MSTLTQNSRLGESPGIDAYFKNAGTAMPIGLLLTTLLLVVIGLGSLLISEQVLTGWLALGERTNISRRDINILESIVLICTAVWGLLSLRSAFGLWRRDRTSWSWAMWLLLLTMLGGGLATMSSGFDLQPQIEAGTSLLQDLPLLLSYMLLPILLVLLPYLGYRYLSTEIAVTPDGIIRSTLAKSPGAGAIIGFIFILGLFSVATDLFLAQTSLAGILATNITRGIVAIGITFLMISGEFDLSVGSVFGAGALVFLLIMTEGIPLGTIIAFPLVVIGIALIIRGGRQAPTGIAMLVIGLALVLIVGPAQIFGGFFNQVVITTVIPALFAGLIFAGFLGFINGGILIQTGIPSFIVTLGTLLAYRAILLVVVADGRILRYADYRLPDPFVYFSRYLLALGAVLLVLLVLFMARSLVPTAWLAFNTSLKTTLKESDFAPLWKVLSLVRFIGTVVLVIAAVALLGSFALNQVQLASTNPILEISFFDLANGKFDFVDRNVNLRIGVMWWALLVLGFQYVLTQTSYGNHVLAVGGNPGAARAQGINVNRVKVTNFIICSVLAALAGIISVARLANVDPLMGQGLELEVIAASVIGGALLSGGYGSIVGALLGVFIFGMLQTGLVLIGLDSRMFSGVIGVIIIVAVVINTAVRKVRR